MEDNSRYIVNWWSWKFKSRTGTRGAAVRYWLSNCEVAGSVPTRVRWCALLKSSKQNETAVQCSSQFSAFNFTDYWWIYNWKSRISNHWLKQYRCILCPLWRSFSSTFLVLHVTSTELYPFRNSFIFNFKARFYYNYHRIPILSFCCYLTSSHPLFLIFITPSFSTIIFYQSTSTMQ